MSKIIFTILFIYTLCSGFCQDNYGYIKNAGIYTSIQFIQEEKPVIIPQLWFYENDYYIETRFNYEELNSLSVYFGKTISLSKKTDIELTPVTGIVIGNSVSFSPGFLFSIDSGRLSISSENQFTLDMNGFNDHFFWDWTKINYSIADFAGIGCGMQFLYPKFEDSQFDFGPMINLKYKNFGIDIFSYNFWKQDIFWVLAFSYDFERE